MQLLCMLIYKIIQGNYSEWLLPFPTAGNRTGAQTRQALSVHVRRGLTERKERQMLKLILSNIFFFYTIKDTFKPEEIQSKYQRNI